MFWDRIYKKLSREIYRTGNIGQLEYISKVDEGEQYGFSKNWRKLNVNKTEINIDTRTTGE